MKEVCGDRQLVAGRLCGKVNGLHRFELLHTALQTKRPEFAEAALEHASGITKIEMRDLFRILLVDIASHSATNQIFTSRQSARTPHAMGYRCTIRHGTGIVSGRSCGLC